MIRLVLPALALALGFALARAEPVPNPAPSTPPKPPAVSPLNDITPQQWQELSTARAAAMKANPDLTRKALELTARMRVFQQKLDAAILKLDPTTAPIVARIEHGMLGPRVAMPSPRPAAFPPLPPSPTHAH